MWGFSIHKPQWKTLDCAVIYLGKYNTCCVVTFLFISHVQNLTHLLLQPC